MYHNDHDPVVTSLETDIHQKCDNELDQPIVLTKPKIVQQEDVKVSLNFIEKNLLNESSEEIQEKIWSRKLFKIIFNGKARIFGKNGLDGFVWYKQILFLSTKMRLTVVYML